MTAFNWAVSWAVFDDSVCSALFDDYLMTVLLLKEPLTAAFGKKYWLHDA